jgi:RND family efflux transporter MFP subunit
MNNIFSRHKKWLLPVTVLTVAYGLATVIRNTGPELEIVTPEPQPLIVRFVTAESEQVRLTVESQGEVDAEHMIDLVSELQGKITRVSTSFLTGGYFRAGDVLLEIDPTDYELGRIIAEAKVAEAIEDLELEQLESELASKGLFPMREARVASAEARVQSARADLAQAEAVLARTQIRAPFDGRVLFTQADLGQYVSMAQVLGRIFSTDIAEILLPLTDQQLRYLEQPFGTNRNEVPLDTPVTLRAEVGGHPVEWSGRLHRMSGAIDPDNRVWFAVVRVDDPYGLKAGGGQRSPLAVGMFVEAEIEGRVVENVFRVPRSALRNKSDVLVIDSDDRLRQRKVDVLRTDFEFAFIRAGIVSGDRVCISPVETFIDGLLVKAVAAESSGQLAVN